MNMLSIKNCAKKIALLMLLACISSTQIFAQTRTTTFLHHDASGSVVAATNEAGEEIWRKNYLPYGEQQAGSDNTESVAYTGHVHDKALGLTYMKARYYDPQAGRFMGVDPVSVEESVEGNPQMFNRYAYANNNPYRYVDPDGGNPKLIADFALNVALNYATTGSLGLSTALVETAKGAFNPLATISKVNKLATAIQKAKKKIVALKPKVTKKADFEIVDGVRRSKAAELNGNKTINAEIVDANDKVIGRADLPLDALRSPKTNIDLSSSQTNMDRWMSTFKQTQSGSKAPDITVTPGTQGTRLKDVGFD